VTVSTTLATQTTIQQTQSYTGDLRARGQVSVVPKTSGMIQTMAVDVGSQVKTVDTLALLDPSSAQAQVEKSKASIDQAQAKLAALLVGARAEDVAVAQATLDEARSKLANMQGGGRAEDIQVALQMLNSAQAKLDGMLHGRPESIQSAQDAVDAARAKLTTTLHGTTADVLASDQANVNSDTASLASAEAYAAIGATNAYTLENLQAQVNSARAAVDTATESIASADAALANLPGSTASDVPSPRAPTTRRARSCRSLKPHSSRITTPPRRRSQRTRQRSRRLRPVSIQRSQHRPRSSKASLHRVHRPQIRTLLIRHDEGV
jgi:multidrug resistance efflux pump